MSNLSSSMRGFGFFSVAIIASVASATTWSSLQSPYTVGQPGHVRALAQSAPVGIPWVDGVATVAYDRQLALRQTSGTSWTLWSGGAYLEEPSFAEFGATGCTTMATRNSDETVSVTIQAPNGSGGCLAASTINTTTSDRLTGRADETESGRG